MYQRDFSDPRSESSLINHSEKKAFLASVNEFHEKEDLRNKNKERKDQIL